MTHKNISPLEPPHANHLGGKIKRYPGGQFEVEIGMLDLQKYAILRFGSMSAFGKSIGYERSAIRRLLIGERIPKKVWAIERMSKGLGVNPVILTKLFDKVEREGPKATIILTG